MTKTEKISVDQTQGFGVVGLFIVVVILGVVGFIGWRVINKQNPLSGITNPSGIVAAKEQFSSTNSTSGYLKVNTDKFQEASAVPFQPIKVDDPASLNSVVFTGDFLSYTNGLFLYNIPQNKIYKLGDGVISPHIMSDHFVVYGTSSGTGADKKNVFGLLNLLTGERSTITSDSTLSTASTECCSVSPDGLRIAIPRKDDMDVWDIRTKTIKSYPAQISVISEGTPMDKAYYNEHSEPIEDSYPQPSWLDDHTLVYADAPTYKIRIDGSGNLYHDYTENNLYELNTDNGNVTKLKTNTGDTTDIYALPRAHTIYVGQLSGPGNTDVNIYQIDPDGQKDAVFVANAPNFVEFNGDGSKLYQFPQRGTNVTMQNLETNKVTSVNAMPAGLKSVNVFQLIPNGVIGSNTIMFVATDETTQDFHEYQILYDTKADTPLQYVKQK